MSLTKREIDDIEQAEELNRGVEERYYGEPWLSEEEMRADAESGRRSPSCESLSGERGKGTSG